MQHCFGSADRQFHQRAVPLFDYLVLKLD